MASYQTSHLPVHCNLVLVPDDLPFAWGGAYILFLLALYFKEDQIPVAAQRVVIRTVAWHLVISLAIGRLLCSVFGSLGLLLLITRSV